MTGQKDTIHPRIQKVLPLNGFWRAVFERSDHTTFVAVFPTRRSAQPLVDAVNGLCNQRCPKQKECSGPQIVPSGDKIHPFIIVAESKENIFKGNSPARCVRLNRKPNPIVEWFRAFTGK